MLQLHSMSCFTGAHGTGSTKFRCTTGTRVEGVRAVVTGHLPHRDGPWWQLDTGAGTPWGCLSLLQIDCHPPVATTIGMLPGERPKGRGDTKRTEK